MGFLTFSLVNPERLVCPNLAVKDLFLQYWFWRIEHLKTISFQVENREDAIAALASGDIRPILDLVSESLGRSVGGHVYAHLSETAIQLAVVMALNTCTTYRVTAEEEAIGAGYTDLILRPTKEHADAAAWLIEFKYIKKTDADQQAVDEKISEAANQLERYSVAENLRSIPNLHKAAAIFAGTKLRGVKVFENG